MTYNVGAYNSGLYNLGGGSSTISGLGDSLRRAIVSGSGSIGPKILARFTQEPDEVLDYDVVYDQWFVGRLDTPSVAVVSVDSGIAVVDYELRVLTKVVKIILGYPADGVQYKITTRLQTTSGIIKEAEFMVKGKIV